MSDFFLENRLLTGILLIIGGFILLIFSYKKTLQSDEDLFDYSTTYGGYMIAFLFIIYGLILIIA